MAYEMVMPYHLHMPSYFLETFTEYPLNNLFCTGGEARTPDTRFWRPVLYQLSYSRVCGCKGSVIFGIYKPIYEKILFIIRLIGLTH